MNYKMNFNRRISLTAGNCQDKGTDYDQEVENINARSVGPGPSRGDFRRHSQFSFSRGGYNPRYLSRGGTSHRHPHSYSLHRRQIRKRKTLQEVCAFTHKRRCQRYALCVIYQYCPIKSVLSGREEMVSTSLYGCYFLKEKGVGSCWRCKKNVFREQEQEEILRARLGRRDSAAQITTISPPTEVRETSPPTSRRRRRSSLAQLTDLLPFHWGTGGVKKQDKSLLRRETLGDIAKSTPLWPKRDSTISSSTTVAGRAKRRESSADLIKGKLPITIRPSLEKQLRRGSVTAAAIKRIVTSPEPSEPITSPAGEQPTSSERVKQELQRRNSRQAERSSPKTHRLRRQSTVLDEFGTKRRNSNLQLRMPKIIELIDGGRTQEKKFRDRVRSGSRVPVPKVPFLSPDDGMGEDPPSSWSRKARRDSLSPDSAAEDPSGQQFNRRSKRKQSRRQSTVVSEERRGSKKSPDSSSTCSSREPSPVAPRPPNLRRQSTTEEILIARGFRRQSTTEEMIRCRNFRNGRMDALLVKISSPGSGESRGANS